MGFDIVLYKELTKLQIGEPHNISMMIDSRQLLVSEIAIGTYCCPIHQSLPSSQSSVNMFASNSSNSTLK
jgi:hypothetical protein